VIEKFSACQVRFMSQADEATTERVAPGSVAGVGPAVAGRPINTVVPATPRLTRSPVVYAVVAR